MQSNFLLSNSDETWNWIDGGVVQYENWGPGEPNGNSDTEACTEMYQSPFVGQWNDVNCEHYQYSVCKMPRGILIKLSQNQE